MVWAWEPDGPVYIVCRFLGLKIKKKVLAEERLHRRLKMELDLQSLFGLHVP